MAIMIPVKPNEFNPASQEGIMFDSLKRLPDDYYVFHSFRITEIKDDKLVESETDFVIYNRTKGILCLEAKAGHVRYEAGRWLYESGIEMAHGGPFNQADSAKWKLRDHIKSCKYAGILNHCKTLHAVWFPSISKEQLKSMVMPPEGDKRLVLTKDSLENPQVDIERIFSYDVTGKIQTDISETESKSFVRNVLCPEFNVFPSASFDTDIKKIVFNRLLREQANILNFLTEQKTAVINGAAGTGKTMIAIEKARRHAAEGEKVLFLCFNVGLKNFIAKKYADENIEYYTISGLACKLCNTVKPDYQKLKAKLEDMYLSETFPYQHVIVDEGQDFGLDSIDEANILDQIKMIITDIEKLNGTFYIFYDKLQLIQADHMPKFIEDADCKLTLYRNCRNTENIAITSLRPFTERKPKLIAGAVKGLPAKFHFCNSEDDICGKVDSIIDNLKADGITSIVILTCKTENESVMKNKVSDGKYRNKYLFTTCRKYKGLEADAVILLDVDGTTFNPDNVQLYYVGTSRAKIRLDVITTLNDEECENILTECLNINKISSKPKKDLCKALNGVGSVA